MSFKSFKAEDYQPIITDALIVAAQPKSQEILHTVRLKLYPWQSGGKAIDFSF